MKLLIASCLCLSGFAAQATPIGSTDYTMTRACSSGDLPADTVIEEASGLRITGSQATMTASYRDADGLICMEALMGTLSASALTLTSGSRYCSDGNTVVIPTAQLPPPIAATQDGSNYVFTVAPVHSYTGPCGKSASLIMTFAPIL